MVNVGEYINLENGYGQGYVLSAGLVIREDGELLLDLPTGTLTIGFLNAPMPPEDWNYHDCFDWDDWAEKVLKMISDQRFDLFPRSLDRVRERMTK